MMRFNVLPPLPMCTKVKVMPNFYSYLPQIQHMHNKLQKVIKEVGR